MDDRPFAGRTALVTGAAARLGRTIALRLGSLGASVVVHHNANTVGAYQVCSELQSRGVDATPLAVDLADTAGPAALIAQARKATGKPLDFLVNNAAIYPKSKLETLSWTGLENALRVNAWAPFELTRAFAAQAKKGGGVVNLLDTRIADYDWDHVGYILSKQMLAELTRLTAIQYAPLVRVNGVAPGPILPPVGEAEATLDRLSRHLPLRATPSPDDVADAVIYLLGSRGVTGEIVSVDGGRHLGKAVYDAKPEGKAK
ncbi:MAG: SDR family oxidoreductase [Candidatus Thermoplasmatota archaeon]